MDVERMKRVFTTKIDYVYANMHGIEPMLVTYSVHCVYCRFAVLFRSLCTISLCLFLLHRSVLLFLRAADIQVLSMAREQ